MIIKVNELSFSVNLNENQFDNTKTPLLLLHGFTGSKLDWNFIYKDLTKKVFPIAIDLIGHGNSDSPNELNHYLSDSIVEQLKYIIEDFTKGKIYLLGYSMGGRAALSFALKYPQEIKALILESSSAGIKTENERLERIKKDEELADFILNNPIEKFVDNWMKLDIFATQKRFSNQKLDEIKKSKLDNNKIGLANSLKGFSTGKMPSYYGDLKNFQPGTLLITGELDSKFTDINIAMASLLPNSTHEVIKNAGHNTHLEEPKKFIESVNRFLEQF